MSSPNKEGSALVTKVTDYVKVYMSHYDGSHDFSHILRVLGLAQSIASLSPARYDSQVVTLAALLHDVGDKKYLQPGQDASTLVQTVLLSFGADEALAAKVQAIASAVSYSSEIKNPQKVLDAIARYPELAVVQDADRLDAIGAIGIGRTFTFTGAFSQRSGLGNGSRGMEETIEHFTDKLERLEGMMKTEEGSKMAKDRTARLKIFRGWWEEEQRFAAGEA